ncbi:NAD(P)/FAD-dependent oxidoreductase [Chthonobacter albigriseus]|uniref:NAD(P)/FAD-dependent oxidoreductase n=1 Tax=Chthonobacter albigriseus TaxID=1683161 RepID=UPI0015EF7280|nr:FAD-dependent oxidoreductase [Chthonobacter albigriseus]
MTRICVVGAGIGGLTLARALAGRGAKVDVVEQGPVPNPVSSSHDEHRVIRHAYGAFEGYGRMMPSAFAAWDRLFADLGTRHFAQTGSIFVLRGNEDYAARSAAVMRETGATMREIPLDALADRLPMINPAGVKSAFETPADGMLFNTRILGDLTVHLSRMGVTFHPFTAVTAVDAERGVVSTSRGEIGADAVVVAAGAWMPKLLPSLAETAVPSRQAVVYLAPPVGFAERWSKAPVVVDFAGDQGIYTIPPREGTRLKVGDHVFTMTGDADDDRTARADDVARLLDAIDASFVGFDGYTVLERKICYYTVRPEEAFLARPIGTRGWVLSACSGHGFKFAPLIADIVAAGVLGERPAEEVSRIVAGEGTHVLAA